MAIFWPLEKYVSCPEIMMKLNRLEWLQSQNKHILYVRILGPLVATFVVSFNLQDIV